MNPHILSLPRGPQPVPMIDLVEQFQGQRDEIMEAVERVFEGQKFILGEEVENFEQDVARFCDSRFAISCASGTDALMLALKALGVGRGDEVITTPYSFFATASAIARVGARPVFADIEPITFNLSPEAVENAITSRTKAIMPVHLYGQCADMEPLWRLSVRHGLAIVEDACQAIGATYRGRKTGVLGNVGCFSFFPTKNLGGAGDGGVMTTDDQDVANRLKRLRVHGDLGGYNHVEIGMNSRLDALQAAILAVKLRSLDKWSSARQENAIRYTLLLGEQGLMSRMDLPAIDSDCGHVFNQYVVRVNDGLRNDVLKGLKERQVGCAIYYPKPLHMQDCFQYLGYQAGQFPEAERAANESLALPIYPELGIERQQRVAEALADVYAAIDAARSGSGLRRAA
jgi:dTDP-4-amino-4,6-dideoxygalactose transaminase